MAKVGEVREVLDKGIEREGNRHARGLGNGLLRLLIIRAPVRAGVNAVGMIE